MDRLGLTGAYVDLLQFWLSSSGQLTIPLVLKSKTHWLPFCERVDARERRKIQMLQNEF